MAIKYIKHLKYLLSFPEEQEIPAEIVAFDPTSDAWDRVRNTQEEQGDRVRNTMERQGVRERKTMETGEAGHCVSAAFLPGSLGPWGQWGEASSQSQATTPSALVRSSGWTAAPPSTTS